MTTPRTTTKDLPTRAQIDELHKDFAYNDKNHDGRINFLEFRDLLEDLDSDIDSNTALIGFREIDADHDGAIDFDEFVAWWTSD